MTLGAQSPTILLIVREPLEPGAEAEYDRIETETAVLAARLKCPHPYLALKPLSGATNEIWWLNEFDSPHQVDSVGETYKANEAWSAALAENQKRKAPLTGKPIEQLADLEPRADAQPWMAGLARYVVVAVNPVDHLSGSHVFRRRDGARYEILMGNERADAEWVARGNVAAVVLEVVPRWSFPAKAWVDGNPQL